MSKTFDTAQEFGPYGPNHQPAIVQVQANGGSLTIVSIMGEAPNEIEVPVPDGVINADTTLEMTVANARFRATPAGGCVFAWTA